MNNRMFNFRNPRSSGSICWRTTSMFLAVDVAGGNCFKDGYIYCEKNGQTRSFEWFGENPCSIPFEG